MLIENRTIEYLFLFFFLFILSCNDNEEIDCFNGEKGEIVFNSFDCNKHLIHLDNGSYIQVLNLEEYSSNIDIGIRVQISYEESSTIVGNTCMNGKIVELNCYREI